MRLALYHGTRFSSKNKNPAERGFCSERKLAAALGGLFLCNFADRLLRCTLHGLLGGLALCCLFLCSFANRLLSNLADRLLGGLLGYLSLFCGHDGEIRDD